jgi:multiple sugar transport system substrate-binding protein
MKLRILVVTALAVALLGAGALAQTITLWTTEEQPERIATQQRIAANFRQATGITVNVVPVTESALPERITAAFAAGALPDVVFHSMEFTLGWARQGILDVEAADEVVRSLGITTFSGGVLDLVSTPQGYAAVPADGWAQLLLYRTDLFAQHGLAPPRTFQDILNAARALHDPPRMYGFVNATDPGQVYLQQVFEHFALANGVRLTDAQGRVTLDTPAMSEVLQVYNELAELSPPGLLYWLQSRELYQAGRAAMIVWSPFILDELAGLRAPVPVPADAGRESGWLARNTGFVTRIAGPRNPGGSGYTQIQYFGITTDANTRAAQRFVQFVMNEGYLDWLSMAAEGKFPLRRGTRTSPNQFIDGWSRLEVGVTAKAPLGQFYSPSVIQGIMEGLLAADRWGFREGQGALVTAVYGTRVIPEIIRRYLDGELTLDQTRAEIARRVAGLQ